MFMILCNPYTVMLSVRNSLIMCYSSVIPSLYVFMVFSLYISQGDYTDVLSLPLRFFGRLMKTEDNNYSACLLLSLIGGFAVGASMINKLHEYGYSENSLKAIAPSMINNSLSFCVMAVGAGMLGNYQLGLMLFISLTAASLITSFIFSFLFRYDTITKSSSYQPHLLTFVECVNSSVKNILSICGFVILFNCICEVVSLYTDSILMELLLFCFTEVTAGCSKILYFTGKNPFLLCAALSIFPVCTICQVK